MSAPIDNYLAKAPGPQRAPYLVPGCGASVFVRFVRLRRCWLRFPHSVLARDQSKTEKHVLFPTMQSSSRKIEDRPLLGSRLERGNENKKTSDRRRSGARARESWSARTVAPLTRIFGGIQRLGLGLGFGDREGKLRETGTGKKLRNAPTRTAPAITLRTSEGGRSLRRVNSTWHSACVSSLLSTVWGHTTSAGAAL